MAYVELQYKGNEPCCRCVHKKVCEATRSLDEIRYTVRHLKYPLFNINVECTEYYNEKLSTMAERQLIEGSDNNDT